jgi:hypothetical protein
MSSYGWQVFNPTGNLIADNTMFNCFYVDHWQCPAHYNSRTHSFSKSYPALAHSTLEIIVGPSPGSVGSDTSISATVSYPNGVPTVNITETVGSSVSAAFGSTYWIVATKISPLSPINNTYGIQLFDGSSGVSFVDGLPSMVYIGKGSVSLESIADYSSAFKGYFVIETWNNVPPVCFWRTLSGSVQSISNIRNESVPYLSGVRKSSVAPKSKNFRWVLMVQYDSGFGTPMSDYNKEVFCFEPYHSAMDINDTYGLQVRDGTLPINIGTQKPLYIKSLNPLKNSYLVGNNLRTDLTSTRAAISNVPYIFKWTGTYSYDTVFWLTSSSWLDGIHTTQASGGTSHAGYSADWWRTARNNTGYDSFVIDYGMYI